MINDVTRPEALHSRTSDCIKFPWMENRYFLGGHGDSGVVDEDLTYATILSQMEGFRVSGVTDDLIPSKSLALHHKWVKR